MDLDTRVAEALDRAGARMGEAIANALDLSPDQAARLQRLGGGLELLAGPIAGGLETRIREAIDTFVTSREGDGLLVALVTKLHERTVLLLRDELDQLPSIDVESGEVKLNLVPMVAESIRRVVNAGIVAIGGERQIPQFDSGEDAEQAIDRLAGIVGQDLPPDFGQVALMSEDQLRNAQGLVQTFDRVVWVLIGLAILLSVLAVLLAPSCRPACCGSARPSQWPCCLAGSQSAPSVRQWHRPRERRMDRRQRPISWARSCTPSSRWLPC